MRHEFRRYLSTLIAVSRWQLVSAIALMTGFSLTEGVGIALLLPTLQVAGLNLTGQGEAGRYAHAVTAAFAAVGLHPDLLMLLGMYVVLAGLRTLVGRSQTVVMYRVQQDFEDHLRRGLYRAISGASWLFVSRTRASDFTHALTSDIDRVASGTFMLMQLASDLVIGVLYVLIAFALSTGMTLLVLGCALVLALTFRHQTQSIQETGEEVSSTTKSLFAAIHDHLLSLKTAKAYGAEHRNAAIFSALSRDVADSNVASAREQARVEALFQLGSVVILAIVLYASIRLIGVPPAAILILLLLFARVMPRFMSSHHYYRGFINAMPSFTSVCDLEARCIQAAESSAGSVPAPQLTRELRLEDATFGYNSTRGDAVRELNIEIKTGHKIALVGPSGAGKSTAADLLMGLIFPDSGRISVDGATLRPEQAPSWRENIGYVASDTFLFHDTIRANLLWARPGATDEQMRTALARAAADFVGALPAGLDTVVGDRGVMLSQGERQRLALARAFLRHPALLVLDEATNSLDSDNEARILAAIVDLGADVTVIMIAHRLSTIRSADTIYVIENGRVVESGRWEELSVRRDGRFRLLWEAQTLGI
jgi:ATP-binding cassette, subfamily C, bacterial